MSKKHKNKHQSAQDCGAQEKSTGCENMNWPSVFPVKIETTAEEDSFKRRQLTLASRLNWITGGAALVGLAGLLFLYGTLRATKESADAAIKAASIADKNLQNSKLAFQIEERPFLVVSGGLQFDPAFPRIGQKNTQVDVLMANVGKTPAVHVTYYTELLPYHPSKGHGTSEVLNPIFADLRAAIERDKLKQFPPEYRRDVAPGQNALVIPVTDSLHPLSPEDLSQIISRTIGAQLFCVGIVTYSDALGGDYETEFYYFYSGPVGTLWRIGDAYNIMK